MTDLPPDVRDRAAAAAVRAVKPPLPGAISFDVAGVAVDAVTAVLAPEIARPLQARIEELESTLANARELWDESIAQTGAVVELLTAALTELSSELLAAGYVAASELAERKWRAALAAGETESETRTLDSESKVPEDEVSQVNDSRGKRRGDPKSAQCPYGVNGDHEWGPDPDDPDVGDACTLCGLAR